MYSIVVLTEELSNIVDEVHHAFPNEQVYAVVGGFHLKGIHGVDSLSVTEEEVIDIGASLFQRGVSYIYTGHCTGRPAFDILKREFGEKVLIFVYGNNNYVLRKRGVNEDYINYSR